MSGASHLSQGSALLRPQLVGASVLYRLSIGYLFPKHLFLNLFRQSHPKTCNVLERWDNNGIEVASENDIVSDILFSSRLSAQSPHLPQLLLLQSTQKALYASLCCSKSSVYSLRLR